MTVGKSGVAACPEPGIGGDRPHRRLREVGGSHDHRPACPESRHGRGVLGWPDVCPGRHPTGPGESIHCQVGFRRNRYPVQGAQSLAVPSSPVRVPGLCQGPGFVDFEKAAEMGVSGGDLG